MSAVPESDIGPLVWVKSEIDLSCARAVEALENFATGGDSAQLKFAATHLHQAQGALAIVGLDGATLFAQTIESLVQECEHGTLSPSAETIRLAQAGLELLRHYLDDLANGQPDQPFRLLPVYLEMQQARGAEGASPGDLFFPDLNHRPPRRPADFQPPAPDAVHAILRRQRMRFQRGLLQFLRHGDGMADMRQAIAAVEACQVLPAARSFWWAALGFFDAVGTSRTPPETAVKRLCGRIDGQLRRLISGSPNVSERLMRDVLYQVATTAGGGKDAAAVREAFALSGMAPAGPTGKADVAPQAPLLRDVREAVLAAKEDWERFCAGAAIGLPQLDADTERLDGHAARLNHPLLRSLAAAIRATTLWLRRDPLKQSEALGMEVATALLLMESALENFERLDEGFQPQVEMMVARLAALQKGAALGPLGAPLLDEMSRKAQERLVMRQVVREIQNNLSQIEQALDAFFRDPGKRSALESLTAPIKQVEGALAILNQDRAVSVLHQCGDRIAAFAAGEGDESQFEEVADKLSALGFFVASLPYGNADIDALLHPEAQVRKESGEEEAGEESVEQQLEHQKRWAQELAEALEVAPEDEYLRDRLHKNLEVMRQDANLAGDAQLEQRAEQALMQLAAPVGAGGDIKSALGELTTAAPAPSAETTRLAESAEEEIDAELLAIFLEEAREVLATIEGGLRESRADPHDHDVLTTIRRGFHTLKGSGRMVNLKELGEAAWAVEQVMNRWLQLEKDATPDLHTLIAAAHELFGRWVAQLEAGGSTHMDAAAVTDLAEILKTRDTLPPPAPTLPLATPEVEAGAQETEEILLELPTEEAPEPETAAESAPTGEETALDFTLEFEPAGQAAAEIQPWPEEHPEETREAVAEMLSALGGEGEAPPSETEAAPPLETLPVLAESPEEAEFVQALMAEEAQEEAAMLAAEPAVPAALPLAGEPPEAMELIELADEEARIPSGEIGIEEMPALAAEFELAGAAPYKAVEEIGPTEATPEEALALQEEAPPPRPDQVAIGPLTMSRALYDSYVDEALGRLTTLRAELDRLPQTPFLPPAEAAYRAAHTLAGISGTVGFAALQRLARSMEHLMQRLAEAEMSAPDYVDLLNEGLSGIELMLGAVVAERMPEPMDELAERIEAAASAAHAELHHRMQEESAQAAAPAPALPTTPAAVEAEEARTVLRLKDDIDSQLLPIFLEESVDLMRDIESESRLWHGNPGAEAPAKALARLLHTLKGSARMAGVMSLGEIVHALESRLDKAVATAATTPEFFEGYHTELDRIGHMLDRLRAGEAPEEAVAAAVPATAEEASPAAMEAAAAAPVLEAQEGAAQGQQASLRVRAGLVDQLVNQAGEMSIARARIEGEMRTLHQSLLDLTENVIRLRKQLREIEIQAETQMQSRTALADESREEFDPLEFDRFTRFQELTRMMAESVNDVSTVQHNLLKNLDQADAALASQSRINRELAQSLMSVRMVPFNSLASRLHRLVRQTAKELGKKANLDIRGGQVELDRSVLERIAAPLEHLLRNSITHGIEAPAERHARGKAEIGEISLTVAHQGNEVSLEMSDDGAGLDYARIRARAEERGLLEPGGEPDQAMLTALIFQSGFSTAEALSEVAGRGVGMDVVKSETAALGGRIDVSSGAGQGTQFHIYLPLTLAVTQAVLVKFGAKTYAIPSSMVEQVRELKPAHLDKVLADGGMDWMGAHYPYHFLARLFGDSHSQPATDLHHTWLLLLKSGNQRIALHVDEMRGNQEVVVKNIGPQLARVVGIAGATVLGDGEVVLIINPVALAARELTPAVRRVADRQIRALEPKATAAPTIMVVDDSLTVRKITGRLLEREGYRVVTAKDGVDALEQLLETVPDAMLVDIEMPRMDGFDLSRNIRADKRLKHVPIIMITSRTAEKHRAYAREIGVNHYLGKPFQEDELLGLLRAYTRQEEPAPEPA